MNMCSLAMFVSSLYRWRYGYVWGIDAERRLSFNSKLRSALIPQDMMSQVKADLIWWEIQPVERLSNVLLVKALSCYDLHSASCFTFACSSAAKSRVWAFCSTENVNRSSYRVEKGYLSLLCVYIPHLGLLGGLCTLRADQMTAEEPGEDGELEDDNDGRFQKSHLRLHWRFWYR